MNSMTHKGCAHDDPDTALAFGKVRGCRIVLASLHDDEDARRIVFDEIGDCAECLRAIICFIAGLAGSIGVNMAKLGGADKAAAVRQFEEQLGEAIDQLPR
jgi:hypothetical protein